MSKLTRVMVLALAVPAFAASTSGAEPTRMGTVVDTAGTSTELSKLELKFDSDRPAFLGSSSGWKPAIWLLTEPLHNAIPFSTLKAIRAQGDKFEVSYVIADQEKKAVGKLVAGTIRGESEFGKIEIPLNKLRELTFSDPPGLSEAEQKEREGDLKVRRAMLVLNDGAMVSVSDLVRIGSGHAHYFIFTHGKFELSASFGKLKQIKLEDKDQAAVTFASGASMSLALADKSEKAGGYTGINDEGSFFVDAKFVSRIDFEPPSEEEKKSAALYAPDAKGPSGTLVDSAGTSLEISNLRHSNGYGYFSDISSLVMPARGYAPKDFHVRVPLLDVKTLKKVGDVFELTSAFTEQEYKTSGPLVDGTFYGDSALGSVTIESKELTQLTLTPSVGPSAEEMKARGELLQQAPTTLVLSDGKQVQVHNLERLATYYSTAGYIIGGRTGTFSYKDFRFLRGESELNIEWSKLQSIEFEDEGSVKVTVRSGSTAVGKISEVKEARIDGFTGITSRGQVFIAPKLVKKIVFSTAEEAPTR